VKRMNLAPAMQHMFLALLGLAAIGCGDNDCPLGSNVGTANGEPVCSVYSEPDDDRPCRNRDTADCETGSDCILDQVCAPTACNGGYCGGSCEMRTVCIPLD